MIQVFHYFFAAASFSFSFFAASSFSFLSCTKMILSGDRRRGGGEEARRGGGEKGKRGKGRKGERGEYLYSPVPERHHGIFVGLGMGVCL